MPVCVTIGALDKPLINQLDEQKLIDVCEKELPRTQHCVIVKQAVVAQAYL